MEKIVDATYDGEVIRFDQPVDLPSNTKVKVIIRDKQKKRKLELVEMPKIGKSEPYSWLKFAMEAKLDGPRDFSTNLDDYLNGAKSLDDDE